MAKEPNREDLKKRIAEARQNGWPAERVIAGFVTDLGVSESEAAKLHKELLAELEAEEKAAEKVDAEERARREWSGGR